jgi:HK97 family phage portal protein
MPWQWPWRRTEDRALWQVGDLPASPTWAGVRVTPDTALRLGAVWACIRLLADTVAGLPIDAYRAGAREPVDPKPVLLATPAAYTPFADWVYAVMVSALTTGNAYGLVTARAGAAERPTQIDLVEPDRVQPEVDPVRRTVTWRLDGSEIDREDLWHLRAYPKAGQVEGLSPIRYAAESIGLGLGAQQYGAKFFGDGATPSGVLSTDQRLTREQAFDAHQVWMTRHKNRRGIAVLGNGIQFRPVSIRPDESQFLDTQKFTVQQVARLYGVPPEMIGAESGASMTYANIESRDLSYLKYGVGPWLARLERAVGDLLPRGTYVKFNVGGLLRTDLKTRYESYKLALEGGWLTLDEVRELEDREPLPPSQPGGFA